MKALMYHAQARGLKRIHGPVLKSNPAKCVNDVKLNINCVILSKISRGNFAIITF
jgi:hypothetical protein